MSPSGLSDTIVPDDKSQSGAESESKSQDSPVTGEDILGYTTERLASYLKKHRREDKYDVSDLVGVESLSESQREDLERKIRNAIQHIVMESYVLQKDRQEVPAKWRYPRPQNVPVTIEKIEVSSRQELIRDGGRPVCSIAELLHILKCPPERHEAVLSWLNHELEPLSDSKELHNIFSRQFWRWWEFRKSQWNNRGLGDSEAGFSAFLEACKRKSRGAGETEMSSDPSIHETIRHQWQDMSPCRLQVPPNGDVFSAHSNAVKIRLAPYNFNPLPQLRRDPQKQTAWTNWLEYLSFELDCLNTLNDAAESLDRQFHRELKSLRHRRYISRDPNESVLDPLEAMSAANGGFVGKPTEKIVDQLIAARDYRRRQEIAIDQFLRDTKLYTKTRKAAMYQRYRVEWVVKEARLMEAEKLQQRKSKKRKLA